MKAVIWHGVGKIALEQVPDPGISDPADAVIRITTSTICGTDLHFVRGTMGPMRNGTILGHEAVGVVEALGPQVSNFSIGDRVVIPSTIACGSCVYCRAGYHAQCGRGLRGVRPARRRLDQGGPRGQLTAPDSGCSRMRSTAASARPWVASSPNSLDAPRSPSTRAIVRPCS